MSERMSWNVAVNGIEVGANRARLVLIAFPIILQDPGIARMEKVSSREE